MDSLRYSEVESTRFKKDIYRGSVDTFDIDFFKDFYEKNDPDTVIVRIPVKEQHKLSALSSLDKDIIFADTLVYYEVDLKTTLYAPVNNRDLVFYQADTSHRDVFKQLIPQIFDNYTTHYFSNPVFDKIKITEGYIEWAINGINAAGNLHFLVNLYDKPIAFITCSYSSESSEIILNGVLPEYQGKKIYQDMVRYVKDYLNRLNIPVLKISTQIQNFAVQKVWNKEGFILNNAYVTIHLNKKNTYVAF
jgi:RimJ/RimL family protein N-acetyltransferase